MAVSFVAAGAVSTSTSTCRPGLPAGIVADDVVLLWLVWRSTDSAPDLSADGFTFVNTASVTQGSEAADSGTVSIALYQADGSVAAPSIGVSGRNGSMAWMTAYHKTVPGSWIVSGTHGTDSTVDTTHNADGFNNPSGLAGHGFLVSGVGVNGDAIASSRSSISMSWPGATLGTLNQRASTGTTAGNDMRMYIDDASHDSGTPTGAPDITWTWGTGGTANTPVEAAILACVREPDPNQTIFLSGDGIGTGEAFGTATVANNTAGTNIAPSGIASAQGFGTAVLTTGPVTVTPSGIGSAAAFGSATVAPGPVTLAPSGIATAAALGSATLTTRVTITASGIASAAAFGTATLSTGPVGIAPTGVASAAAFGTAIVGQGGPPAQDIDPSGVASAEALGTATVTPGGVSVAPSGLASAEAFGTATVAGTSAGQDISPAGIASAEALGTGIVTVGAVTISLTGITTGEGLGTARLTTGPVDIAPTGIPAPSTDELAELGFNSDFEIDLDGWQALGTSGATISRDTTTSVTGTASLKLVHEGGGPSEADNSLTAFANGAGAKRITVWMKASNAESVDVFFFSGEFDEDWDHEAVTNVAVTTEWAPYVFEYDQPGSKFTAIDFDQKDVYGALPGTALWIDSIVVEGVPTITQRPAVQDIAPTGIPSPDTEVGDDTLAPEWNTTLDTDLAQWGAVGGTFGRITTGQYEGAGAFQLTHGPGVQSAAFLFFQRSTPVPTGLSRLRVAMRADTERRVRVDLFDSTYTEDHFATFTVGTDWAVYEFDFVLESPNLIETDFTQYTALGAAEGSNLYIDSLELRAVGDFGIPDFTTSPVSIVTTSIPSEEAFTRGTKVHRLHRRILRTPSVQENLLDLAGQPQPWSVDQGISLLKIGGTYHQVRWPTDADIASATAVYRGGFDHEVDDAEVADLTAAGYGGYIQLVPA